MLIIVVAAYSFLKQIKIRWHTAKLNTTDCKVKLSAVKSILECGNSGIVALSKYLSNGAEEAEFLSEYLNISSNFNGNNYHSLPLDIAAEKGYVNACELFVA